MRLRAALFRHRGLILVLPAAAAIALSERSGSGLLLALPWLAGGLGLRAASVRHLGSGGRTRDPSAPAVRVVTGPYVLFAHPIYVANLVIACGLLVALGVPPLPGAGLAVAVALFYGLLAGREERLLDGVPVARRRLTLSWRSVARAERSTWAVLALLLLVGVG